MSTTKALREVFISLGGDEAELKDTTSISEALRLIEKQLGGTGEGVSVSESLERIAVLTKDLTIEAKVEEPSLGVV